MIIERTFGTTKSMHAWISDSKGLERLKKKYPPSKYSAEINLDLRRIEVTEKNPIKKNAVKPK